LFERMYFADNSTYNESDFETRFRIPRVLFERIYSDLKGHGVFVRRRDALGNMGIHPKMRIISALSVLAYGVSFDGIDELCRISRESASMSFKSFVSEIVKIYAPKYLRAPTESDLRRILSISAAQGFPGCLGSWDCRHWEWDKCPVAWAGQFKGKEKAYCGA